MGGWTPSADGATESLIEPGRIAVRMRRPWYERPVWRVVGYLADLIVKFCVWMLAAMLGAMYALQAMVGMGML